MSNLNMLKERNPKACLTKGCFAGCHTRWHGLESQLLKCVFFWGWGYIHFYKATSRLLMKIFKNGFHYMKGYISFYNGNQILYPMAAGIQG